MHNRRNRLTLTLTSSFLFHCSSCLLLVLCALCFVLCALATVRVRVFLPPYNIISVQCSVVGSILADEVNTMANARNCLQPLSRCRSCPKGAHDEDSV
jgi:thiosulfate reductase cytochrome b subunit